MAAEWEIVYTCALPSQVEDLDLYGSKLSEPQKSTELGRRTLGSGTPRLYLDFGYGLFLQ